MTVARRPYVFRVRDEVLANVRNVACRMMIAIMRNGYDKARLRSVLPSENVLNAAGANQELVRAGIQIQQDMYKQHGARVPRT